MKKTVILHTLVFITASTQAIQASITVIENEEQFNKITQSNTPSVIVYSAEWCPACKSLKAPLQKVIDNPEFKYVVFAHADVDRNASLAEQQKIQRLPTIHFMQNGIKKHELIGPRNPEKDISDAIRTKFDKTNMQQLTEAMQTTMADAKNTMSKTARETKEVAIATKAKLADVAKEAKDTMSDIAKDAKEAALKAQTKLVEVADDAKEKIVELANEAKDAMAPAEKPSEPESSVMSFFHAFINAFASIFNYAKETLVNVVCKIKNLFSSK